MKILGVGTLTWTRLERKTGRRGAIMLENIDYVDNGVEASINRDTLEANLREYGELSARIIEPKKSDSFLPDELPEKNGVYHLGTGRLFREIYGSSFGGSEGKTPIGVLPRDYTEYPWLENTRLLKDSGVELLFEPKETDWKY